MKDSYRSYASIETLRKRAQLVHRIRAFLDGHAFFEVQTPVLSGDTVVDRFIEPISVEVLNGGRDPQKFWLQTSPEFCMKRLLAGGAQAIYQIGPAFRAGEVGQQHNLEFTILEWYRVGDDYHQGIDLLDQFAQEILGCPPANKVTYRDLFIQYAKVDPFAMNDCEVYENWRIEQNNDDTTEFLNHLLVESVEPNLKNIRSAIIYDWPADQAALARVRPKNGIHVAERFELYVDGVELANGYHELTDAAELRARNQKINWLRTKDGREPLPENSRLIEAMENGLPDCCGVALGVDRLVMMALDKSSIAEVMPFPSDRA